MGLESQPKAPVLAGCPSFGDKRMYVSFVSRYGSIMMALLWQSVELQHERYVCSYVVKVRLQYWRL